MASEIPEIVYSFSPQLKAFMAVPILLTYFRRKLLQFEWRQVPILGMPRFISLTKLSSAAFFHKNFTLLQSKFHIWRRFI